MKKVECIVVGQGVCGTFLTWYLKKAGMSFIVIDNNDPASSSRVAAGVINPVTGRRIVKTWMIDELMPFVQQAYGEISDCLGIDCLENTRIVNLFPTPQMRNAFAERAVEEQHFLELSADDHRYRPFLEYAFGSGEIRPAYLAKLHRLLPAWREELSRSSSLIEEEFELWRLAITDNHITYKDLQAERIIFCDGSSAFNNEFFRSLPFAPNKGEALVLRIKDLPTDAVFKKAITLVPLEPEIFWAGASHEWEFSSAGPTEEFRTKTEKQLRNWLKIPFSIEDHVAAIRPATLERRPFVGLHPHFPRVGILNGMGTKGCSLAPYFANEFAQHLTKKTAILPQADVGRFTRILTPGNNLKH
jgi:glycine/D-amino acid oxidase-like deaminating enzyme